MVDRGVRRAAEQVLRESMDVLASTLGRQHPKYAEALLQLAATCQALQQPDLATTLQREAEVILARAATGLQEAAVRRLNAELERRLR